MAYGDYDHLNLDEPINATVDMDELARRIVRLNYGIDRFLSSLVRALREPAGFHYRKRLSDKIEALLDEGIR